jgi:hypothetical protein
MIHPVAVVRTDVSEERIASVIRVTRIGGVEGMLAVTSNRSTLRRNAMHYTTAFFSRRSSVASYC